MIEGVIFEEKQKFSNYRRYELLSGFEIFSFIELKSFRKYPKGTYLFSTIDGHGVGVGGVHPCMTSKNCPTPGAKKTGGGAPWGAKHPGEKKF